MSDLGIPGCPLCADGTLHEHCGACGNITGGLSPRGSYRAAERELCKRWLDWAENWGDDEMRRELILDTKGEINHGNPRFDRDKFLDACQGKWTAKERNLKGRE